MANYLSIEKRKRIFHLLCEGNGIRSITRLIGCSKNAVSELQKRYCMIVEFMNKRNIRDLVIDEIEADEIRTFVGKKDNIRWIYIAICRKSRMVLHFHIGNRDKHDSKVFLSGLSQKLLNKALVSTDCLPAYVAAVDEDQSDKSKFPSTYHINLVRSEDGYIPWHITNRIETHNGNVRQHISRLIRKTRCFSKKEEGLRQHLTLFFFYFNFIKKHKSLKIFPAAVAGVTDEANWLDKIIEYDMMFTGKVKSVNTKRNYGRLVNSVGDSEMELFIDDMKKKNGVNAKEMRGAYNPRKNILKVVA